jgi:hypothetical protein
VGATVGSGVVGAAVCGVGDAVGAPVGGNVGGDPVGTAVCGVGAAVCSVGAADGIAPGSGVGQLLHVLSHALVSTSHAQKFAMALANIAQ